MLRLIDIVKEYPTGDSKVTALKGVGIEFRRSEFVSILGHSGCGKTTLLNIIGGLDHYTSGDLIIEGKSTKDFNDGDWDNYRNHSVGFIFQSYNLIPHQTVLSNVELALTLSGVSKAERKQRAIEALQKVGLGDQIDKKPNQLSGGQMQRVAIARALVNDPEIVLADEPTGALDSETSVQIMDILREVARDRLVIMVTHNPELAEEYSTRIIRLIDGKITSDTNPYTEDEEDRAVADAKRNQKTKKPKMSTFTALALSLNNLMTKKGRTFLTSFAGSIGIIGIALILSLSNGFQLYINSIQRETLSSYPITIDKGFVDMSSAMQAISKSTGSNGEIVVDHDRDKVYSNTMASAFMSSMTNEIWANDLGAFKKFIESDECNIKDYVSSIQYKYASEMNIYSSDASNGLNKVYPSPALQMMDMMMSNIDLGGFQIDESTMESMKSAYNSWLELVDNEELLKEEYDLVKGTWPQNYNEVVLIVDRNNEISPLAIQGLGLISQQEMMSTFMDAMSGEGNTEEIFKQTNYDYDTILGLTFKLVLEPQYFSYNEETKQWDDRHGDDLYVLDVMDKAEEIKVVGIIRPADGAVMVNTTGTIGFTSDLTEYVVNKTNECEIVKQQKADPKTDVFTGLPFETEEEVKEEPKAEATAVDGWEKPVVSSLAYTSDAPTATFTATNSMDMSVINNLPSATEEQIYAAIDEQYDGEEARQYKRMVELMLKDMLSISEKNELNGYVKDALSQYPEAANNGLDAQSAVNLLRMLNKTQRLKLLNAMVTGEFAKMMGVDIPGAETTVDPENPEESAPEEVIEEPEEEKPKPYAASYEDALSKLGVGSLDNPSQINIYPKDFESKDAISAIISEYNKKVIDNKNEKQEIKYTDFIGLLLSSVTKIINIVSYVLIAFVAISLVVSSIMIGIITYISVLERTKEIGILRAIGASKRDISRVFNAETLIVGFVSGFLGIVVTLLLNIPINMIIKHLTDLPNVAQLPVNGAIILVLISMFLTVVAGLIPSRIASKKDPVVALRTE